MTDFDPDDIESLKRRIAQLEAAAKAGTDATRTSAGPAAKRAGKPRGKRSVAIAGLNAASTNTGTQTTQTAGGAAVQGAVRVRNGHFIGRDYIHVVTQAAQPGEDAEEAKSVIALYLHALAADLAGLKLGEIDASANQSRQTPLQLADIYVPLDTTLTIAKQASLARWLSSRSDTRIDKIEAQRETRPVPALEALAQHRELTLLGKPGGGKSTFGASVLLALAHVWQGHTGELEQLGPTWTHGAKLPIRVILRRFAEALGPGDAPARAGDLWDFAARELRDAGHGLSADAMKFVERIARNEGALILFDGLDECGSPDRRERVLSGVRELMKNAGPKCRFLLTARPYAWPGGPDPQSGVYALADLDDAKIERFIGAWYGAVVRNGWLQPGDAARKQSELLAARHRADIAPLARNPLLLTLIAALQTNRSRLPDDRADLYHESVDLLMLRWNRQIGADKALLDELNVAGLKLSDLRDALEEMAFDVHDKSVGRDGAADIGEGRLVRAFSPLLGNSQDKAGVVVDYIEKRAGLLVGQGEKDGERQFAFPHRTFQEFLAACRLAAMEDFPCECARLARAAPAHWQVVLPLAARVAKAERGASAADELIGGDSVRTFRKTREPAVADWTCALLAGMQLQEIGPGGINKSDRTRAIADRVAGWLVASLPVHPDEGGMPAVQRAQAGDVLAALGDQRFDAQRLYLPADGSLGFVRIEADPGFRIGTRRSDAERVAKAVGRSVDDDEINDAPMPSPAFHIARYPVTVAQFRVFVEATRFALGDEDALRDPDSRPVRSVSWHEARAYCEWLNEMLATSALFDGDETARLVREHGWRVALPSELEWEKAARGGLTDAVFPWGDLPDPQRANYDDSSIGNTSAVGCFPPNGYGLHDMAGNVWEWTRSLWTDRHEPDGPQREDAGANEPRVVRGGSWIFSANFARAALPFRDLPVPRIVKLGFRLVLRSAPVLFLGPA